MNFNKTENNKKVWDSLIEEHYESCCDINSEYKTKYTKTEMSDWCYSLLEKYPEKDILEIILGSIYSNKHNQEYHPV